MSDKYFLTRRNIEKQGNIIWKCFDKPYDDYVYKAHLDFAEKFTIEQIEEMQQKNIDDLVFDYAYNVKDVLEINCRFISSKELDKLKSFRLVKANKPKRKPLPDGTLPLTEEELKEFNELFYPDRHNVKILFRKGCVTLCFKSPFGDYLTHNWATNVISILWLAKRFQLTDEV